MHGKPKKISQFGQAEVSGDFEAEPHAYTSYEYQHEKIAYDKTIVNVLNNEFKQDDTNSFLVSKIKSSEDVSVANKLLMGTEFEMVTDGRRFVSSSYEGGISLNVDVVYALFLPVVVPTGWPTISEDISELKTAVSNKAIFNSGILVKTTNFQDGAEVITEHTKWDKLTGRPMLTEITERFADKKVYSYSIPGYSTYEGMGPAYQNSGLSFSATAVVPVEDKDNEYEMHVRSEVAKALYPGDEIIFHDWDGDKKGMAIYLGNESGQHRFFSTTKNFSGFLKGTIARSGRRNQLVADVSSFSGLHDPSKSSASTLDSYSGQLIIPNNE